MSNVLTYAWLWDPQVIQDVTYAEVAKKQKRNLPSPKSPNTYHIRHFQHTPFTNPSHDFRPIATVTPLPTTEAPRKHTQQTPIPNPSHDIWTGNFTRFATSTPLPTTEAPRNNYHEPPEALSSVNIFFLYFMLPACISAAVTGLILYMFLLIRKYIRSRSQAAIDKNSTGNEIIYADLELEGTNNFQRGGTGESRGCTEESPYAQIQISQMAQK